MLSEVCIYLHAGIPKKYSFYLFRKPGILKLQYSISFSDDPSNFYLKTR